MIRGATALLFWAAIPMLAMAADGRPVFEQHCASCHAVTTGAPAGAGPSLAGLLERRIGGDPAFDYSPVLQAARDAGRTWDTAMLEQFLADPDEMFPGTWMGANRLRSATDRAAIIEYLRSSR